MKNPTMLYKYPGQHKIHGDLFDYVIVDESDVATKLKDGWCKTTVEAKSNIQPKRGRKPSTSKQQSIDDVIVKDDE